MCGKVRLSPQLVVKLTISGTFSKLIYHNLFFKEMSGATYQSKLCAPEKRKKAVRNVVFISATTSFHQYHTKVITCFASLPLLEDWKEFSKLTTAP